jgi:hypothetical protein
MSAYLRNSLRNSSSKSCNSIVFSTVSPPKQAYWMSMHGRADPLHARVILFFQTLVGEQNAECELGRAYAENPAENGKKAQAHGSVSHYIRPAFKTRAETSGRQTSP